MTTWILQIHYLILHLCERAANSMHEPDVALIIPVT